MSTLEEFAKQVGQGLSPDIRALNRVIEYNPEDLTITVELGISYKEFQNKLSQHNQWLPLDPSGDDLTLHKIISYDLSGPRRFGYGTIRDYLIGLTVAMPDGRLASSGGRVVKNVAGYDMMKLYIGAQNTLGIPVQGTFKLLPRPETESFYKCTDAAAALKSIWNSQTSPTVLDLVKEGQTYLVVGFAGTAEDVAWQVEQLSALKMESASELSYASTQSHKWVSVPPSKVFEKSEAFKRFIARAGNGIIYTEEAPLQSVSLGVAKLQDRLKQTFDPRGILPKLRL